MYDKAIDDTEKAWSDALTQAEREYNGHLDECKKRMEQYSREMKVYETEYKNNLRKIQDNYHAAAETLKKDMSAQYDAMRKEIEGRKKELDALEEDLRKKLEDLQEREEGMSKRNAEIIEQYDATVAKLKEKIEEDYGSAIELISLELESDPDLDAHSLGQVYEIRDRIENLRARSVLDAYYYYAELIVIDRRMYEYRSSLNKALDFAEETRKRETAMAGIREMVLEHIDNDPGNSLLESVHEPPWGPFFCSYSDVNGNLVEIIASEKGFDLTAMIEEEDESVRRKVEADKRSEFTGLYHECRIAMDRDYSARDDLDDLRATVKGAIGRNNVRKAANTGN